MNTSQALVESLVDAIQIWNREDDIETSNSENIDHESYNVFST